MLAGKVSSLVLDKGIHRECNISWTRTLKMTHKILQNIRYTQRIFHNFRPQDSVSIFLHIAGYGLS